MSALAPSASSLANRLREEARMFETPPAAPITSRLLREAADRIEALEAEISRLEMRIKMRDWKP